MCLLRHEAPAPYPRWSHQRHPAHDGAHRSHLRLRRDAQSSPMDWCRVGHPQFLSPEPQREEGGHRLHAQPLDIPACLGSCFGSRQRSLRQVPDGIARERRIRHQPNGHAELLQLLPSRADGSDAGLSLVAPTQAVHPFVFSFPLQTSYISTASRWMEHSSVLSASPAAAAWWSVFW